MCASDVTKQYNGTGQWAVMPCGWEGNRRRDVTLAMRHTLHGLRREDEHPIYLRSLWSMAPQ